MRKKLIIMINKSFVNIPTVNTTKPQIKPTEQKIADMGMFPIIPGSIANSKESNRNLRNLFFTFIVILWFQLVFRRAIFVLRLIHS
jgi:hypothetical protein